MNDPVPSKAMEQLQRENAQLKSVVNALYKRHYGELPLPPEKLRLNVGTNTSEANFWAQGVASSTRVLQVFGKAPAGPILDWGCGSGRTLRWLVAYPGWRENYHGTDVDREAIAWLAAQGQPRVMPCNDDPPLPYADQTFQGLFAFSVLTHIPPRHHRRWYEELRRILRPGGLAYLTTLGPSGPAADIGDVAKAELSASGHAYLPREGHYKNAAIVTEAYTRQQMKTLFEVEQYKQRGYNNMDIYVVRRTG